MRVGLTNPYWEHGFTHIDIFLNHGGCDTITGKLLTTALEQHQLAIGRITSMLSLSYNDLHHFTEPSWVTNTWKFICEFNIQLKCNDLPSLAFPREHDRTITETLKETCDMSTKEEIAVNRIRCYLQVLTIANIAAGCGTQINHMYLDGKQTPPVHMIGTRNNHVLRMSVYGRNIYLR